MNPERWRRIEQIYNRALELEPGRRAAFLEGACAEDDSLRREVERLLARQPQAEDFIESPAIEVAARALANNEAPEDAEHLEGRTLLHYRIAGRIGAGGMGVVYRAQDTRLNRPVAIKVLPDLFAEDAERLARFEREARLLAALSHPNIAPIHGLEKADGRPFLVLGLVEGVTLEERLKRGPLPVTEALEVCRQVAEGLEAAHDKGIIHRDLKPANIKLTTEGQVKILDFGLAKALHDPADSVDLTSQNADSMTASGVILGTAAYMSPEQARGKEVDRRTDVWSFGCVLYECLTARRAFGGETLTETVAAILRDEPDWSALPKSTPPKIVDLLHRCLRKDPRERLHDIGDARIEIEEASARSAPTEGRTLRRLNAKWWLLASAAVILTIAGGYWGWDFVSTRGSRLPEQKVVPLTSYPGFEHSPSFSPDGREVVFAWNDGKGGSSNIYRKLIGSDGKPLRLTSHPLVGSISPAWSPDGNSIAFFRSDGTGKRSVMIMPPLGGPERKLTECAVLKYQRSCPLLAWTPDSRFLAVVDSDTGDIPYSLSLVSVETGERRRLTSPAGGKGPGDSGMSFSPDGRTLAFVRSTGHYSWDLFALSLSEDYTPQGEPRRLTFDNEWGVSSPVWTSDGREIVFISNRQGGMGRLWRMDSSAREAPKPISISREAGCNVAISRQGDRLVYTARSVDTDIWKLDLPQHDGMAGLPTRLISSSYLDNDPHFSPDGRKIAFQSTRSGWGEIWVADGDGLNPTQLTHFQSNSGGPEWSPDSRQIVFCAAVEGNYRIFAVDANGGKPRRLTNNPAEEIQPRWSFDGKWIYFTSTRTGEYQLWKIPASGGEARQVTRKGGIAALESKDGRYLYYTKQEGPGSLWRVPSDGGEEVQIVDSVPVWNSFTVVMDGLYYVSCTPAGSGPLSQTPCLVRFYRFADRETRTVASLDHYYMGLSVSPDRRTLLYTTREFTDSDLMLVENFR